MTKSEEIQRYLHQKDYIRAETLIRDELEENPTSSDAHYWMGILNFNRGQLGQTVEHLKKALEADPKNTDAAICLSVLYNDIGKYDEAKKVFEQANQSVAHKRAGDDIEIDRKFSVKHLEIADLYFRYRRYDEAVEEYSKAILLDPTSLELRIRRAKAFAKKGFLSRAIQELQQLKSQNPRFIEGRLQLGLLYYSQGNLLDAELEWEGVLEMKPNHREAQAYLEMAKKSRVKQKK